MFTNISTVKRNIVIAFSIIAIFLFTNSNCKEKPIEALPDTMISGKVVDENGATVEGAKVTTSPSIGQATTNSDGSYTFNLGTSPNIVEYTFTASKSGFQNGSTKLTPTANKTVTAGDITITTLKPNLDVSPPLLAMGTTTQSGSITLTNITGVGSITWTASVSQSAQTWLILQSPTNGTITGTGALSFTVDRANVQSGNYDGIITINGGSAGTKTVTVTMTKSNPNAPQISVSPVLLNFLANETQKQIIITNSGTGTLNWNVSSVQSWVSFDQNSGVTNSGGAQSVVIVTVSKTNLPVGETLGKITVNSNNGGGSQDISVTVVKAQDFGSVQVNVSDEIGAVSDADIYLSDNPAVSRGKTINGIFTISNVAVGSNYTVTAKKSGYIENTSPQFAVAKDQTTPVSITLTKATGSISGKVTLEDGTTPVPNVTVKVSPADASDIISSDGNFTFTGLKAGTTYKISAVKTNYDTVSSAYAAIGTTNAVVKMKLQTGVIAGKVTLEDETTLVPNVTVKVSPADASDIISSDGNFSFSGLKAGTTYKISAVKANYDTVSSAYAAIGTTNAVVKMKLQTGVIAGKVTLEDETTLVQNVTVKVSPADASDIISSDGNFSFSGLKAGVKYTVTAVKENYDVIASDTASIGRTTVNVKMKLQTGVIAGKVTLEDGTTLVPNVTVKVSPADASDIISSDGNFSFSGLKAGTTYKISAVKTNYDTVSSAYVAIGTTNAIVKMKLQTGVIAGKVTLEDGATLVPNVTVKVSPADAADITSSDGNFSFSGLKAGTTYTITATKTNYDLVSSTMAMIGTTNAVVKMKQQTGSIATISGTVKDSVSNLGVQATIAINPNAGTITQPNANGEYSITGLPGGNYTITATLNGYDTKNTNVNVTAGSNSAVNIILAPSFLQFMVFVEGGTFTMGSPSGTGNSDEQPQHSVTLSSFYIGKFEVTQKRWREVVQWKQGSATSPLAPGPSSFSGDGLPVENVSWHDIQTWLGYLNEREGITDNSKKYRLLTEAEWEYAARGGKHWQDNFTYSGSNNIDNVAWYNVNSDNTTKTVGTKSPNQLGIYDMSGNVWEWVEDWYHPNYNSAPNNGTAWYPQDPSYPYRVLRGGSWLDTGGGGCRVAYRNLHMPDARAYYYGFRLVKSY